MLSVSNSELKLQNERRLAKGEVTMCVGSVSKVDVITIHAPSIFGISVEARVALVSALSMNMIRSCLLQYGYSFKSENNGYFFT